MQDSIFTRIIKGEIPCHKIYEDDETLAFLDINPATEGHTLVVPKNQVEFVWDMSNTDYDALLKTVKKVALQLRTISGKPYVGELVVGVDVPHAHVHLIPFDSPAVITQVFDRPTLEPDHAMLAATSEKFRLDD